MSASEKEPVRVGLVGLGRSGWRNHALALELLPETYRVVAAADPIADRRAEAEAKFGCRTYDGLGGVLADDDVELVTLATPSRSHPDDTVAALKAGKHVVCEKPMAVRLDDADRMLAAAEESGRILTVFQSLRYAPDVMKVREVCASGVLGCIHTIHIRLHDFSRRWDWQTLQAFDGGCLNDNGVHVLDAAMLLFGDANPRVFCRMERTPLTSGDAEDHAKVILTGPDAPLIDIEVSSACAYPEQRWLVMGTLGALHGTHGELNWKYLDPAALPERQVDRAPTPDRSYNREDLDWHEESCRPAGDGKPKGFPFYTELYPALREGAPVPITAESVRRVVAVLEECRRQSPV